MISCLNLWIYFCPKTKKIWYWYIDGGNILNHIIFEPVLFLWRRIISCGPGLLMGLTCWPILSSSGIGKLTLASVEVGDDAGCCAITVCSCLLGLRGLIIDIIVAFFYQPSVDIIVVVVHISLTPGVLQFNLRIEVWQDKSGSLMNNVALGAKKWSSLIRVRNLKVFSSEGKKSTIVWEIIIFITTIYMI